jgi:hypothetical protein
MTRVQTNEAVHKAGGLITHVSGRGRGGVRKAAVTPDNVGRQGRSQWEATWGTANKTVANAQHPDPADQNADVTLGNQGAASEMPEDVLDTARKAGFNSGRLWAAEHIDPKEAQRTLRLLSDNYATAVGTYPTRDGNGREAIQASFIDGWGAAFAIHQGVLS